MPRVPIDYSKTVIYKLVHKDDVNNENIYIGSTINFIQRKWEHSYSCNNPNAKSYKTQRNNNTLKYKYIRENGGWENWIMVEIEKFPCVDKREAETRERYWIEHYKSNLNVNLPIRTKKEYWNTHKEHFLEKNKLYRDSNKSKILEQKKIYYENNKEKRKEYAKKFRIENKEKLNRKTECECGCVVQKAKIKRHQQSNKHIQLMSLKNQI